MIELLQVFRDAAPPQKAALIALLAAIIWALVLGGAGLSGVHPVRRDRLMQLAVFGPALGLLAASLNAVHMMQTTLRLPVSPTAAQLAPGVIEAATFVGLGALCGLVAIASAALTPPVEEGEAYGSGRPDGGRTTSSR